MKYIDADLLRKEIERRLKYTHDWLRGDERRHPNQTFISKNYYKMKGDERTLDALLNIIDSLQQEQQEVDLDKEIEEYWVATEWSKVITLGKFKVIARYFYGLGQLNSK